MSLFFVYRSYKPGEAFTNRSLSYFHALSKIGIAANVVYLLPDNKRNKVENQIDGIDFTYYWDNLYFGNNVLRVVSYLIYIIKFLKRIKKGDKVYIYDNADLLRWILKKKGVSIYYEVTEHPSINPPSSRIKPIPMSQYLCMCKKVKGLFVISSSLKDYYIMQGVDANKIEIINMIVDAERFEYLEKLEKERYFAYCGTLINNKDGVDLLIKSFALFHKRHPDVKLKIIGRTPSAHELEKNENIQLIKKYHLDECIEFTGFILPHAIPQYLKDAEALILARPNNIQAQYGFPTKLGEYLLTKNPVVVTAVGDIPLFLKDGESALIAEAGNIESISKKMCWVAEHPSEAKVIGEKGYIIAKKFFNNVEETKKMLSFMKLIR